MYKSKKRNTKHTYIIVYIYIYIYRYQSYICRDEIVENKKTKT